ncbi:MAG: sigma-70 family RNA polymerase sigma factor [Desulfosarcinaceae bacterium]|nr:sigma-70 family RNA polymerase sigma factor [Desulfosarcinaceae bacterium]
MQIAIMENGTIPTQGAVMISDQRFDAIFNEYRPKIQRYLSRLVSPVDAEDLSQEVFDKVNRGLSGFHGRSSLSTWIYRIATNVAIDRSRSAVHKHESAHDAFEDEAAHVAASPSAVKSAPVTDQLVIRKEMGDCISEYIDSLPPNYRIVIVLSELEGFANKEIAGILDISLDNVKIRLHRARAKLKKALQEGCNFYYTEGNTLACDRKPVRISTKMPD